MIIPALQAVAQINFVLAASQSLCHCAIGYAYRQVN